MTARTKITSIDEAMERLIEAQVEEGGVSTQPAFGDTLETPTGWVFFNVNGYLGTVTADGDVIVEDEYLEDEYLEDE